MPPPDETNDEPKTEANEPARPAEEEARGDPAPSDAGAPQTLSILFLAAAGALVLLLAMIGLIAYFAMGR